ncbi:MAG: hypothetical protein QOJ65_1737 [Fimbriimonadaceae bacterium]|jgi:hypothetical protein|nr:hypothetical protein [Fimbriimonadaceae bacterium]
MQAAAHLFRSARALVPAVVTLLILNILLGLCVVVVALAFPPMTFVSPSGSVEQQTLVVTDWLDLMLAFPTAACFLTWVFRSVKAAVALDRKPFAYSPVYAVVTFFIPIMNIYKPLQMMRDTFWRSTPDAERLSVILRIVLWVWWLCWLISSFVGFYASYTNDTEGRAGASAFSIVSAAALIVLVRALPGLQQARLAELASRPPVGDYVEYPRHPESTTL